MTVKQSEESNAGCLCDTLLVTSCGPGSVSISWNLRQDGTKHPCPASARLDQPTPNSAPQVHPLAHLGSGSVTAEPQRQVMTSPSHCPSPAEAGAADQNLPSGPGSSEPSAFQPALHPRGLQMVLGAHRPLASPPCHRSPRLGTQGLRGRPPARCPARRLWSTEPASVLTQLLNTFLFQEPGLRRASEWPRGGISPRARSG